MTKQRKPKRKRPRFKRGPSKTPPAGPPRAKKLHVDILPQPNDTTCGPTCLHSVYRYYEDHLKLKDLISEMETLADGGTLAVFLACHALNRGYKARIYTNNLGVFDPTWFKEGRSSNSFLQGRLREQMAAKNNPVIQIATLGYLNFLSQGGEIRFGDLSPALLRKYMARAQPIIAGLSSTFLYQSAREIPETNEPDDIAGNPCGHFVVLCGYDQRSRDILIADPYYANPVAEGQYYKVSEERLIASVLLGILTHDANLLVIEPSTPQAKVGLRRHHHNPRSEPQKGSSDPWKR